MLPAEAIRITVEVARPLARRLVPRCVHTWLRGLGYALHQQSRAVQAHLPEPVVVVIKLAAAWTILPLLVLAFGAAPGFAKLMVGAIVLGAVRRAKGH